MNAQFYTPTHGWLHALDTRVKLFMSLVIIVLCALWGNLIFLAVTLIVMHIMLLTDHVPACRVGKLWAYLAPICIIVWLVLLVSMREFGNDVIWQAGWWRLSSQTLIVSTSVILRIADIVVACFLTLFTTSSAAWIQGFTGLHIPITTARTLVRGIIWIPTFAALVRDRMMMRTMRGAHGGIVGWIASLSDAAQAMRVQRDQEVIAVRTRGLYMHTQAKRTLMVPPHMRLIDWLILLIVIVIAAACIVMMRVFGW